MSEQPPKSDEAIIRLRGVGKKYRLYQQPLYRFLDLFGLCPPDSDYYTEHEALTGIDLEVGPGEKVAIIGRNGAGKSTLLKIIAGLVRPSGGTVEVRGHISNLLQIGTGFHPDFTGRQNVFASLAHQGIIGGRASRLFEEIVDFAEIEEYIDQPMKTYSTGMCSRLMFSSSVLMTPDILIVDEILGVGDAYFAHKSFKRMRDLCANDGTTLLLVTHDLNSALNLCERFIWIDRGRIWFEGDGRDTVSRYESSIKEQEEQALRQRNVESFRQAPVEARPIVRVHEPTVPEVVDTPETIDAPEKVDAPEQTVAPVVEEAPRPDEPVDEEEEPAEQPTEPTIVHVFVRSRTGFALPKPLGLCELELIGSDGRSLPLMVAEGDPGWQLTPDSNLGGPEVIEGRRCRALETFGSIYHKVEWTVQLPGGFRLRRLRVRCHYRGSDLADVRVILTDRTVLIRGEITTASEWQDLAFERATAGHEGVDVLKQVDYGTATIRITAIEFIDRHGHNVPQVAFGEPLIVRVHCAAAKPLPGQAVTFAVGFARQGFTHQAYMFDHHLPIPEAEAFVIESRLDEVRLGSGMWYVNIGVGKPDIFRRTEIPYFSVDPSWHHLISSRLQFRVLSVDKFDSGGCFYHMPATISALPSTISRQLV